MAIQSKHQKVSSYGDNPRGPSKEGYAANRPPDTMVGSKRGKDNQKGYSGPNVAKGDRALG